ncbi:MAG: deoxyribonuclease IV [Dehalococcoidia bacterium]
MRIGAHVSTAGALDRCVDRACEIGSEAIQIFAAAPQSWRPVSHSAEAMALLRSRCLEREIMPVFVHGVYLVNLAGNKPENVDKSVDALAQSLRFCEAAGALGTIFHVGSHLGAGFDETLPQVARCMREALKQAPGESFLIIENSAGMGNTVAAQFAEIGAIMREVGSPRVKVCIDTCHAFASGYDIASAEGIERAMDEFEREVGIQRMVAVHANDSKGPLAGGKDRHENIGAGFIGLDGFRTIMRHAAFRNVPFLLEVPGFSGNGPDKENIDLLKRIRDEAI